MKEHCMCIYQSMLRKMRLCRLLSCSPAREIENCFQIAYCSWENASEKLKGYDFPSDEDEIEFFRVLKPRFTSEIEYYSLLYHCLLFAPYHSSQREAIQFWQRECNRLTDFEKENGSFLKCYDDSNCDLRSYYFLRRYCVTDRTNQAAVNENSRNTNGDRLVARYLALKRFQIYAGDKLVATQNINSQQ